MFFALNPDSDDVAPEYNQTYFVGGDDLFRFYDFFKGAGLATLALKKSWNCIWANDIDQRKAQVYMANFPSDHFVCKDIAEVTPEELPEGAHMAWASFPCQDLSLAGWRRGISAERSGTFWQFWRLMHEQLKTGKRPPSSRSRTSLVCSMVTTSPACPKRRFPQHAVWRSS